MLKNYKQQTVLAVVFVMILLAFSGCGASGNQQNSSSSQTTVVSQSTAAAETSAKEDLTPIRMTAAFGCGWPNGWDGPFDDPTAKEITKKTGVEIENIPLGESKETMNSKLNIMLVSGDYPEIMRLPDDLMKKYMKEGALFPLDELIEKYGPNIKRMYGEKVLKKYKDPVDGKIYYVRSFHGIKDTEGYFSMNIKYSLLKQLDPVRADSHEAFTPEAFYQLLKTFKEKFPTIDGKPSIPLTFSQDQKFYDGGLTILGVLKAAYGIKAFSEDAEHNLKIDLKDPRYIEVLKLMSRMQREKLMDSEWPTMKYQVFTQKIAAGNVLAHPGGWFETIVMGITSELEKNGPEGEYYAYAIAAGDVKNPPLAAMTDTGHDMITITKNCKNPERAMRFLDYLASEDGNFLVFWGPQGTAWDVADGKRVIKDDMYAEFMKDSQAFWTKYKIRNWIITCGQDSELPKYTFSDGTTFKEPPKADSGIQRLLDFQKASLVDTVNTFYDSWPYEAIYPETGSDEGIIWQKFADIKEKELFKIILNSKNDEEVQQGLDKLLEKVSALGIEKVEKFVTEKYKARLELLK